MGSAASTSTRGTAVAEPAVGGGSWVAEGAPAPPFHPPAAPQILEAGKAVSVPASVDDSWSVEGAPPPFPQDPASDLRPLWATSPTSTQSGIDNFSTRCEEEPEDFMRNLVEHQLYMRGDPFKYLTNKWLEGGPKLDYDPDEDEELYESLMDDDEERLDDPTHELSPEEQALTEIAAQAAMGAEEAEAARIRELEMSTQGYKAWLQARDPRANWVVQTGQKPARFLERSGPEVSKCVSVSTWFRTPAGVYSPDQPVWWWLGSFVTEALHAATALGFVLPVVQLTSAKKIARRNPVGPQVFNGYVRVMDETGRRTLWSRPFLAFVWDFWLKSKLDDKVRLSPQQLAGRGVATDALEKMAQRPEPRAPPRTRRVVQVPLDILRARGDPPALPALPLQLPFRRVLKPDALEHKLDNFLRSPACQARLAMHAIPDASTSLQTAARAIMRLPDTGIGVMIPGEAEARKSRRSVALK